MKFPVILAVALAIPLVAAGPAIAVPAHAQHPAMPCCQGARVFYKVVRARHPALTYKHLSKADKILYSKTARPHKATVVRNKNKNVPPPKAPSYAPDSHKGWQCAQQLGYMDIHNALGWVVASTWLNAERCWKGSVIVYNARMRDGQGGTPHIPGLVYDGIASDNTNYTGHLIADQVSETKFTFGPIQGWGLNQDVCTQTEGPASVSGTNIVETCKLDCECSAVTRGMRTLAVMLAAGKQDQWR